MHILFLSHYFPPEVNAPASRTHEHALRWARQPGVRVTVITNHPTHPHGRIYPGHGNRWLTRSMVDGIQVLRVKTLPAANAGRARRILSFLFFVLAVWPAVLRAGRPHVVVATSPQLFCALAGFLVALLWRRPWVMEVRDIWPESIVTVGVMARGPVIRLLERLELFLYRRAALIITTTPGLRENLLARGVPGPKVITITNGVDLERFQPEPVPEHIWQRVGDASRFVVSYIGTIGLAHGVKEVMLELAQRLRAFPDILLLVVGDGASKAELKRQAAALGLDNLRILPLVPKDEVKHYYRLSSVNLVLLKKAELFQTAIPSKLFEIMAVSRPVLHTVPGGRCQSLVAQADCGEMAPPEDAAKLAEVILRWRDQPERLEQMGRNGRRYVERHFSRDRLALDMLASLHRVVRL